MTAVYRNNKLFSCLQEY